MQCYRLVRQHQITFPNEPVKDYTIWALTGNLESDLNRMKNKQSKIYDDVRHYKIIPHYDVFSFEKEMIKVKYNAECVTNAWLKMHEICNHFKLLDGRNHIVHFDNAAFPGAFIMAINHNCKAKGIGLEWWASSMVGRDHLLPDTFGLRDRYPERWLMGSEQVNGDVTKPECIAHWQEALGNKVDLYTSDVGFEAGEDGDYTRQEVRHLHAHLGQILTGLVTLKNGGTMVVKQYTFFSMFNVTLYAILTILFRRLYICKPRSSRPTNSETYLVGLRFRGPFKEGSMEQELIRMLRMRLENFTPLPFLPEKGLENQFQCSVQMAYQIYQTQIDALKHRLQWYRQVRTRKQNVWERYEDLKREIREQWYKNYPIAYLQEDQKLNSRVGDKGNPLLYIDDTQTEEERKDSPASEETAHRTNANTTGTDCTGPGESGPRDAGGDDTITGQHGGEAGS